MQTASASGRYAPRLNPHSFALPPDCVALHFIPLLAVPLRTQRRLRRRRL